MAKTIIAPSILAADFAQLGAECQRVLDGGADTLHVDVMDGHFVPNISLGPGIVKALRTHLPNAFLDCHLMVSDPLFWVEEFGRSGASQCTFHIEAVDNNTTKALEVINKIKQHNMKAGVALKPRSSVELLFPFGEVADLLLVMTVEPGFGGQKFMADMIPKVATLRSKFPNANIQVDETVVVASQAGANNIVAGTSIFKSLE